MSLLERVNRAQQANQHKDRIIEAVPTTHTSSVLDKEFEELREGVQQHLSSFDMGTMIARNPLQARNEINHVCTRVFEERPWIGKTVQERETLTNRYLDSVFGLGPLEELLADGRITEIMVNGTRSLFYEADGVLHESSSCFRDSSEVYALIDRIISPLGRRVDETSPMVNARLEQGHRVNAIIPPLSLDGPILTIRKFREQFFSLEDMAELGSFDGDTLMFLRWAVQNHCNIAVSGGTGSGKTTLLNALSSCISEGERIITIEDSAELRFTTHPHVVRLEARPKNIEGFGEVTIKDLVINALRMRPDRIVVGECRGSEALDMLQAMNTGHDGSLTTLHANSPKEAISRLTTMVRYGVDLPVEVVELQIAEALDLVVQTKRDPNGKRYLSDIVGYYYDPAAKQCTTLDYFQRPLWSEPGIWKQIPTWVDSLPTFSIATLEEVESWKQRVSSAE
ncbi:CpaF family protein [Anaerotardibacter muris]|uniref:CpaF family protein n=1 Tax=Anaerotardibacter muris TaxID=2941505 RepID=UPI00203E75D7|nr:CpaF family protein [Anaerotardibacter muris]